MILRGAGRAFSAGYDLTGADSDYPPSPRPLRGEALPGSHQRDDDDAWRLERSQRLRMALFDMHKPSIAQIQGYCLAGGTDLALLCDMLVAADDALIGFPPTRDLGSPPNHMWVYHVGPQWAKRLLLSGDMITGAEGAADRARDEGRPEGAPGSGSGEQLADRLAMIDPDLLSAKQTRRQPGPGADGHAHDAAPRGRERRQGTQLPPPPSAGRSASGKAACAGPCRDGTASSVTGASASAGRRRGTPTAGWWTSRASRSGTALNRLSERRWKSCNCWSAAFRRACVYGLIALGLVLIYNGDRDGQLRPGRGDDARRLHRLHVHQRAGVGLRAGLPGNGPGDWRASACCSNGCCCGR